LEQTAFKQMQNILVSVIVIFVLAFAIFVVLYLHGWDDQERNVFLLCMWWWWSLA